MTIDGIALALNVSKATVSRAINGNGRVSAGTRRRVIDYAKEHDYVPLTAARNLSAKRSYNIAFTLPVNEDLTQSEFFIKCMMGAERFAALNGFDLLVVPSEVKRVRNVVLGRKADGVIVTRGLDDDAVINYLSESDTPFVLVGSTAKGGVTQIDNDNRAACRDLTRALIERSGLVPGLISGKREHNVNCAREEGFIDGGGTLIRRMDGAPVQQRFTELYELGARLIFASDDAICAKLLYYLMKENISDVQAASFYSSETLRLLSSNIPACRFDAEGLGFEAANLLVRKRNGENVPQKTFVDYSVNYD